VEASGGRVGMVEGARDGGGTVKVDVGDGDASDGNPWVISHGTHTHEYGYGFDVGVGMGGPKNTHGLPVTNPKQTQGFLKNLTQTC